ncbi:MAG: hypothetical protein ACI4PD_04415 [Butyricicoccus sp.]
MGDVSVWLKKNLSEKSASVAIQNAQWSVRFFECMIGFQKYAMGFKIVFRWEKHYTLYIRNSEFVQIKRKNDVIFKIMLFQNAEMQMNNLGIGKDNGHEKHEKKIDRFARSECDDGWNAGWLRFGRRCREQRGRFRRGFLRRRFERGCVG